MRYNVGDIVRFKKNADTRAEWKDKLAVVVAISCGIREGDECALMVIGDRLGHTAWHGTWDVVKVDSFTSILNRASR